MVMGEGVKKGSGGKLGCWDALVWIALWGEGDHSYHSSQPQATALEQRRRFCIGDGFPSCGFFAMGLRSSILYRCEQMLTFLGVPPTHEGRCHQQFIGNPQPMAEGAKEAMTLP